MRKVVYRPASSCSVVGIFFFLTLVCYLSVIEKDYPLKRTLSSALSGAAAAPVCCGRHAALPGRWEDPLFLKWASRAISSNASGDGDLNIAIYSSERASKETDDRGDMSWEWANEARCPDPARPTRRHSRWSPCESVKESSIPPSSEQRTEAATTRWWCARPASPKRSDSPRRLTFNYWTAS